MAAAVTMLDVPDTGRKRRIRKWATLLNRCKTRVEAHPPSETSLQLGQGRPGAYADSLHCEGQRITAWYGRRSLTRAGSQYACSPRPSQSGGMRRSRRLAQLRRSFFQPDWRQLRVRLLKAWAKSVNMQRSSPASRYSAKPAAAMPIAASTTGTTRPSSKSSARAICSKIDVGTTLRLEASLVKHSPALLSVGVAVVSASRRRARARPQAARPS